MEYKLTPADLVWNRAAMDDGGTSPRPGDRALTALLLLHGLVTNGGVHHALESAEPDELSAAAAGYEYFGLSEVAAFFRHAADDPILSEWTDETEETANQRYWKMVPDDSYLADRFASVFRELPDQFAPLEEVV